jgi:FKBP-type peptidyl-prolyl cis-trans isomerase SlyD
MPKFFRFDYVIHNDDGEVVDSSAGTEALWFVEGDGRMIPGLENAVRRRDQGDQFTVTIGPDEAYGWRQQSLIRTIASGQIAADVDSIEPGMIFQVGSGDEAEVIKVLSVAEDGITIDGNHPLAGVTFHFDILVLEVREATREELDGARLR